jgi:hypothetical protein
MSKTNSTEARRKLLFAGGAGLVGIGSILTGFVAKIGSRRGPEMEARRLASRLDLPRDAGSMMRAFARDPEKVNRFRELTRWRRMRDSELGKC